MKHSTITSTAVLFLSLTHSAVAETSCGDLQSKGLNCFRGGDIAHADDVNHNFDNLLKKIDSLQTAIEGLRNGQQGLKKTDNSLQTAIEGLRTDQQRLKKTDNSLQTAIEGQRGDQQKLKKTDSSLQTAIDGLRTNQKSTARSLSQMTIGDCKTVKGACGTGMFKKPTYYFDRVNFSCPSQRPVLRGLRFRRCDKINSANEGLLVEASCCSLKR